VGAAYALKPDAKTLEARFSGVLDPKGNLNTGLKLLGKVQWDVGSKSDFLRRIVRIAQKEMFLNFALFRNAHPTRKNLCNVGTTLVAKSRCIVPIRRLCF